MRHRSEIDIEFCPIPQPFGRERFLAIMDWMRMHQQPGWKMRFCDTQVHVLSPGVAYSVSLRDQDKDGKVRTSRVTLKPARLLLPGFWSTIRAAGAAPFRA